MHDDDEFDLRRYFLDIDDPEERARTIHESGWGGHPDIEDIERVVARVGGGTYQGLLAALQPLKDEDELQPVKDDDEFDLRRYFLDIDDPEERARTIHESGWEGHPDIEDIERNVARFGGGTYQGLLAALQPVKETKSSDLTSKHAMRLYNAIAFAMWQHEAIMNTHVVILWETLGVYDHNRATTLLSEYLNQAKKWAGVGMVGKPRQRRRERTSEGFTFRFVYVHENATQRGFHTHILCTVPWSLAKDFSAWSMRTLARLARHHGDERTVRVVARYARDEGVAVERCWNWFRYITKQLDPKFGIGSPDEPLRQLRGILKVWPHRTALPVTCAQMVGGSQDIWTKAQREAGFKSELSWGDLERIYEGRELDEGRRKRFMDKMLPTLAPLG